MPAVKPEILVWARQTAGLTREQAAQKLIRDARGVAALNRLAAYEEGQDEVSRPTLVKMAKLYHRPLLTFHMSAPPHRGDRGEDYRTLSVRHTDSEPLVDALVRDIRARQSMVRSVLEDEEEGESLKFINSLSMANGVGSVLSSIRQALDIDLVTFRTQGSAEAAFALLQSKIKRMGVFVLLIGPLGSHHTAVDVTAFRGFALADKFAPFIVINDGDAKVAWSFTLIHELTHLWIGKTGVSGGIPEDNVERFCNDVASQFLLPGNELPLVGVNRHTEKDEAMRSITAFAEERFLSRSLVTYRLFRAETLSETMWRDLTNHFHREWLGRRAIQRARSMARMMGQTTVWFAVIV